MKAHIRKDLQQHKLLIPIRFNGEETFLPEKFLNAEFETESIKGHDFYNTLITLPDGREAQCCSIDLDFMNERPDNPA